MKKVFITGGSKGIGRATALHLASLGHRVAICGSKDLEALKRTADEGGFLPVFGDVADYEQAAKMFNEVLEHFGGLDVLINNAAVSHVGFFADMKPAEWQRVVDVNLGGVINCSHLAVNHMLGNNSGSIINISSIWGNTGAACEAVYSATKGGVSAFTRALAKELGVAGIKVNAIACGVVDTDMNSFLNPAEKAELINQIPLRRFAEPIEIAKVVEFLMNSEYITGQIITVDGGMI